MTVDLDRPVELPLTVEELELIRVALRHLLSSEDDPETISELKLLIARVQAAEGE